jgi:hypothetical protein
MLSKLSACPLSWVFEIFNQTPFQQSPDAVMFDKYRTRNIENDIAFSEVIGMTATPMIGLPDVHDGRVCIEMKLAIS